MSPLLATLALLALCWQPSAGLSWKMEPENLLSFISKEQQSKVIASFKKQTSTVGGPTPEQILALFNLIPNTMILTGLAEAGAAKKVDFMLPSFGNGALCELDDPSLPDKLMRLSGGGHSAAEVNQALTIVLKDKIDCAASPPTADLETETGVVSAGVLQRMHKCICTQQKGFVCLTSVGRFAMEAEEEKKGEPMKTYPCLDETVPVLLKAGSGVLGSHYDLRKPGQNAINDALNGNVDAFSNDQMKNLLCDAVDPEVEAAVKAVFASDGLYWFTESLLYAAILGNDHHSAKNVDLTLSEYCELDAVKADAYGSCLCTATKEGEGTGFTFCIYKVIAEYFINEGHLTCDKADKTKQKLIAERKPRSIPQMVNATAAQASNGAPTGSGAATSSLTAASLAAAALLLLRE